MRTLTSCHFDIVRGCQLRCVGCPNSTLLPKVERIPLDLFDRCLRNIDVDHIEIFRLYNYGEPLLHHDLPGILRTLAGQRWSVGVSELSTNAQHVHWDQLEEALGTQALGRLVVSCDGDGTAERYEALRPPSTWPKLIEFLERVVEIRDRVSPGLDLMTRTVVTTRSDMEAWCRLLIPMGWRPEFRGWKLLPESKSNMTGRALTPGKGVCLFLGEGLLYVDCDGAVVPCCAHPRAGVLGDLGRERLSRILEGDTRRKFIQRMASNRESLPVCSGCEFGPPESPGPSFFAGLPL